MRDYLGEKGFCARCDHSSSEMICESDESSFYGLEVGSVRCAPCHSSFKE